MFNLMSRSIFVLMLVSLTINLNAQITQEYFFNGNFNGTSGGGNLTESLACGAGLGSFGTGTITNNGFCNSVNEFCFNSGGGVSYPNANFINNEYTINLYAKFNTLNGGWTRIIDFSNSVSDAGIYILGGCLDFYPNGIVGTCPFFTPGVYYLFTFVRDGTTGYLHYYF